MVAARMPLQQHLSDVKEKVPLAEPGRADAGQWVFGKACWLAGLYLLGDGELPDQYLEAMDLCDEAARLARAAGLAATAQAKSIRQPGNNVQVWTGPLHTASLCSVRCCREGSMLNPLMWSVYEAHKRHPARFARWRLIHYCCRHSLTSVIRTMVNKGNVRCLTDIGVEPKLRGCRSPFTMHPRRLARRHGRLMSIGRKPRFSAAAPTAPRAAPCYSIDTRYPYDSW